MTNKSLGPQLILHFQSKNHSWQFVHTESAPNEQKVLWLLPLLPCSKDTSFSENPFWRNVIVFHSLSLCWFFCLFFFHCDHDSDSAKHSSASPPLTAPVKPAQDNTRGLHNIDLCSHNLCRQTEHPSCCAGFVQMAHGHWSTCRRPRPLFSPPPLGRCSSQPGWSAGRGLGHTPVPRKIQIIDTYLKPAN